MFSQQKERHKNASFMLRYQKTLPKSGRNPRSLVMARVIFQFARVLLIASYARRAGGTLQAQPVSFANVTEMSGSPSDL